MSRAQDEATQAPASLYVPNRRGCLSRIHGLQRATIGSGPPRQIPHRQSVPFRGLGHRAVIVAAENSKQPIPRPVTPGVATIEQEVEGEKSLEDRYQESLDTLARLRALKTEERDDINRLEEGR